MTPYMLPCIQLTLTGSVWTTVAVSIERYLSVCRGYRSDRVHLFYTAPILFFSIFFNAPRVLEMYTGYVNVTRKFLGYYSNVYSRIENLNKRLFQKRILITCC